MPPQGKPATIEEPFGTKAFQFDNCRYLPDDLIDANGIHDLKDWNIEEKKQILIALKLLPKTFLQNAVDCAGGKIHFVRAGEKNGLCLGSARGASICIYDDAFRYADRLGSEWLSMALAHEVAHLIDFGWRFTYSSEWLSLLHRPLQKGREQTEFESSAETKSRIALKLGFFSISRRLQRATDLPGSGCSMQY